MFFSIGFFVFKLCLKFYCKPEDAAKQNLLNSLDNSVQRSLHSALPGQDDYPI